LHLILSTRKLAPVSVYRVVLHFPPLFRQECSWTRISHFPSPPLYIAPPTNTITFAAAAVPYFEGGRTWMLYTPVMCAFERRELLLLLGQGQNGSLQVTSDGKFVLTRDVHSKSCTFDFPFNGFCIARSCRTPSRRNITLCIPKMVC
jgi:hypothetical protein